MVDRDREISRIIKASKKSISIKTTIPKRIMDGLDIDEGDIVEWELREEKGKKYARMTKLE